MGHGSPQDSRKRPQPVEPCLAAPVQVAWRVEDADIDHRRTEGAGVQMSTASGPAAGRRPQLSVTEATWWDTACPGGQTGIS